jgi:hypothetical protein
MQRRTRKRDPSGSDTFDAYCGAWVIVMTFPRI